MAVLIKKTPNRIYQSVGSIEVTEKEREQADSLDATVEKEITALIKLLTNKKMMPDKKGKGKLEAYWELGRSLKAVVESEDFIAEIKKAGFLYKERVLKTLMHNKSYEKNYIYLFQKMA